VVGTKPQAKPAAQQASGVTRRAVILGFVLLAIVVPVGFYAEIVYAATYELASGAPAMAPLALLLLLTFLNGRLGRWHIRPFSRGELLTVYSIVLVGGPVTTHGIMTWMLATPMTLQFGVRTTLEWEQFLPLIPTWFSPTSPAAVISFFEGQAAVPWALWMRPLLAWGSFMVALFTATLCLVLLLRRQWITHERLSFPLAQVPLEMVRDGGPDQQARLPSNWLFWLGLLLAFALMTSTRLGELFPMMPSFSLTGPTLMDWQGTGPLAGLGAWELWIPPGLIAIAYLIPKDLSFSCWFFWLVRIALTVAAIAAGGTPQRPEEWWSSSFPAPVYQGGGAVLAVAVWTVWVGRRHLGRALRSVFTWRSAESESEPVSYRLAIIGLILSFGYLVAFYVMAGSRLSVGAVMAILIVVNYIVWARLRAETGLGFIPFPLIVSSMVVVPFGTAVFRPREVIAMMETRWSYFPGFGESYEVTTGNSLEAFKIADSAGLSSRRLLFAMFVGLVFAVGIGLYTTLAGTYKYGFLTMPGAYSGWLQAMLRRNGSQIIEFTTTPKGPDVNGMAAIAAGAAVTLILGFLRGQFWWWPFHPIGYLAANCWGMHWFSQPFFLGWAAKSLVVRYGGLSLYRKTLPLAIGLILGDLASEACWVVLMSTLRATGVVV
jgi:hypothetical protein